MIKLILGLIESASSDAEVRQKIAGLPQAVSDASGLKKIKGNNYQLPCVSATIAMAMCNYKLLQCVAILPFLCSASIFMSECSKSHCQQGRR